MLHGSPSADAQPAQLSRVTTRIAPHVLAFVRIIGAGNTFHASDLVAYCTRVVGPIAPDSPSRVLRALSAAGAVSYRVVSRRKSLYLIEGVR